MEQPGSGCRRLTLIAVATAALLAPAPMLEPGSPGWAAVHAAEAALTLLTGSAAASAAVAAWVAAATRLGGYASLAVSAAIIAALVNAYRSLRGGRDPLTLTLPLLAASQSLCSLQRSGVNLLLAAAAAAALPAAGQPTLPGALLAALMVHGFTLLSCTPATAAAAALAAVAVYEPSAAVTGLSLLPPPIPAGTGETRLGKVVAALSRCNCLHLKLSEPRHGPWGWLLSLQPREARTRLLRVDGPTHGFIAGATGAGKSRLAARLAAEAAAQGVHVLVVDPHGEYAKLLPGFRALNPRQAAVNPLDPAGAPPRERAAEAAQLIAAIFRLGPLQQQLLEQALAELYEANEIRDDDPATWRRPGPTLADLEAYLRRLAAHDKRAALLASYIALLAGTTFSKTTIDVGELFESDTIIDLSQLRSHEQKRLYVDTLLRLIYTHMQLLGHAGPRARLLIVLDEAHIYAPKDDKDNIVAKLYAEARKYGIVLIALTQQPSSIHHSIPSNAALRIALRQPEPREAKYMAQLVTGRTEENAVNTVMKTLALIDTGWAVTSTRDAPEPLLLLLHQHRDASQR